jgi:anaerobic ribonucleoside-triphosphate reductase activating protein
MTTLLNIHSVIKSSRVNGPGTRLVVFTQGCKQNCPGCFNKELHPFDGGMQIDPTAIIKEHFSEELEGITISGGEPFEQPKALFELVKRAKEKYGLTTVVYTGFDYATLSESAEAKASYEFIDVLIDGAFMEREPEGSLLARGSTNQSFVFLSKRYSLKDFYMPGKVEIFIGPDGTITGTGFSDPGFKVKEAV